MLLNRATSLLTSAVPPATDEQLKEHVRLGLEAIARSGYVAVHEAGVDARLLRAFESLEAEGRLPVRVYAMLAARDEALCRAWLARGTDTSGRLTGRSAKAFYDGALGAPAREDLLGAGVRILEYAAAVLHAKTVVADGYASVVGSTNLDFRSFASTRSATSWSWIDRWGNVWPGSSRTIYNPRPRYPSSPGPAGASPTGSASAWRALPRSGKVARISTRR